MGMNEFESDFETAIVNRMAWRYPDLRVGEMGSIEYKIHPRRSAKSYYLETLAVKEHVSFDINSEWGALSFDLCKPLPSLYHNHFDLVTNYGTGEHIDDQYMFFLNVHMICRMGGIMLHDFMCHGAWPGHCRFYYSVDIVISLANVFHYEILGMQTQPKYSCKPETEICLAAFCKRKETLPSLNDFSRIGIIDIKSI